MDSSRFHSDIYNLQETLSEGDVWDNTRLQDSRGSSVQITYIIII